MQDHNFLKIKSRARKGQLKSSSNLLLPLLFSLLVLFCSSQPLTAQSSRGNAATKEKIRLTGFVYDQQGLPLEFATVALPDFGQGTHTNHSGAFSLLLEDFSDDSLLIEFRFVNKATERKVIARAALSSPLKVYLKDASLTLEQVEVEAIRERLHSNSSIIIDREAIEQAQAFSLADVLQLLPGKKATAPDLQHPQTLTLRTDATGLNALNNSFGIAIYIDGIRVSNDANMQARSLSIRGIGSGSSIPSHTDGSFDVAYNGFDLRDFPVERIERIEVIQGVADARYGELTTGAILITTRAGASPITASLRANGGSTQATVSKGVALGGKLGALDLSGGYTYSNADPSDKMKSYERINANLKWSLHLSKQLSNTFSFGVDKRLDDVKLDPDDGDRRTFASGHNLKFSNRLSYQLSKGLLRHISLNASYSRGRQETYSQFIRNGGPQAISDKDTTGIYEGYYAAGHYMAIEHIIGIPISINGALDLQSKAVKTAGLRHQFVAGASVASSGNHGPGIIVDPSKPRFNNLNNQSERPVDYSKLLPYLTNIGLYLQDNISGKLWQKKYGLHLGLRTDLQNGFMTYQPRLSAQYQILKNWGLSLAYGVSTKAPGLGHRYPAPTWLDIPLLNLYNGNPDESLYLVYTRQVPTDNSDLRPAKSRSLELSINYKGKVGNGSISLYARKSTDGFGTVKNYMPMLLPAFDYTYTPGSGIEYFETGDSLLYAGVGGYKVTNGIYTADYGVELMFSSKEIVPISTKFSVSTGFVYSEFDSRNQPLIQPVSETALQAGVPALYGVYNGTTYKNKTWNSNLSSYTHIPELGFTVNLSMDLSLIESRVHPRGDNLAVAYIDRAGLLVEIPAQDRASEQYAYLKRDLDVFLKTKLPFIYAGLNLTVAKEIKKNIRLSLRGYNIFNIRPMYNEPGTNSWREFNSAPSITAGLTLTL